MNGTYPKNITAFYSWQSDLPDATNRGAIRKALARAAAKVQEQLDNVVVLPDEAIRDKSGAPNIPADILSRIEAADMFIADVTNVTEIKNTARKSPNPNVVFELGYAAAHLGWERIILLVNTTYSALIDLPFDFDRHRAMEYKLSGSSGKDEKEKLSDQLAAAIKLIVKNNPSRPSESKKLTPEQQKRGRDLENLRWILSTIHFPTLDQHILEAPDKVHERVFYFWEGFKSVAENTLFHLYDEELLKYFRSLHKAWGKSVSYGIHYEPAPSGKVYIFTAPRGARTLKEVRKSEKAQASIRRATEKMQRTIERITAGIREKYLEIDIAETNKEAYGDYIKYKLEHVDIDQID